MRHTRCKRTSRRCDCLSVKARSPSGEFIFARLQKMVLGMANKLESQIDKQMAQEEEEFSDLEARRPPLACMGPGLKAHV